MGRVIVYGVGAVGGALAAALARAGTDVLGIARGAQRAAILSDGLTIRTPEETFTARFDCVEAPAAITFRPDDMILLTMKSQDTETALADLRAAGVTDQAVFCFQNGVANERMALRRFPNVHGVTVMMPCSYLEPGRVSVRAKPRLGLFDIGRFPTGQDDHDKALADLLDAAGFGGFPSGRVMESKYGKLLMNLGNVVEAALGPGVDSVALRARVRAEAEAVLQVAGITWVDVGCSDPRRAELLNIVDIPGEARVGGSTTQSLRRGSERVETDYLNGEIALLARLHGQPAPLNTRLTALGAQLALAGSAPGSMSLAELEATLA